MYFYNDYSELLEDMIDRIEDLDDSVSFLANAEDIRLLMRQIAIDTDILPDLIEFDTEDFDGWYYLSLDYNEYDEDLSYSIVNAVDEDGKFFVLLGTLLVDENVPDAFFDKAAKRDYCDVHTVRITDSCDGDCDNCPHYADKDEFIDVADNSFKKTWVNEDGFHSYYFYSSDKDIVKKRLKLLTE